MGVTEEGGLGKGVGGIFRGCRRVDLFCGGAFFS